MLKSLEKKCDTILAVVQGIFKKISNSQLENVVNLLVNKVDDLIRSVRDIGLHDIYSEILDTNEVCKYLKLSSRTVQMLRTSGDIKYFQVGGKILYKKSELDEFLENYRVGK